MRCNACWRELEARAISTLCGHLLCNDDASKILSSDGTCPICDQVLSKSHMKPIDINPNDEWTNMAMAGVSPEISMKSAYKSVMFYIGQKEIEMQQKMNRLIGQCRQKCEAMQEKFKEKLEQMQENMTAMQENFTAMQEKFREKLEQVHTAYQRVVKKCQMMEQEIQSLTKDKEELEEKLAEKSRQKRKLDEMYDQLRNEYTSVKRSAIQPASTFYPTKEPDLFSSPGANIMHKGDLIGKDSWGFNHASKVPRDDIWPARQNASNFDQFDSSNPTKHATNPAEAGNNRASGGRMLRNLMLSPVERPQRSRLRPQPQAALFTL